MLARQEKIHLMLLIEEIISILCKEDKSVDEVKALRDAVALERLLERLEVEIEE